MEKLFSFIQLKSRRSAWTFFVCSLLLLIIGIIRIPAMNSIAKIHSSNAEYYMIAGWIFISLIYLSIATLALFTERGKMAILNIESSPLNKRGVFWYLKFLIACYALAVASLMVTLVAAIWAMGPDVTDVLMGRNGMYISILFMAIWSPLVYRKLV